MSLPSLDIAQLRKFSDGASNIGLRNVFPKDTMQLLHH